MTTLTTNPMEQVITEFKSRALQISHLLKQVNFSESQAEVIADLIEQNASASKVGDEKVIQILEQKIKLHEEERVKDLTTLSTKGDVEIAKKELELKIEKVRVELEKVRADLEVKIEQVRSSLIQWVAGLMIAQTGILFTLIKLFA